MPRKARYDRLKQKKELAAVKEKPSRAIRNAKSPEEAEKKTVKALARVYTEDALETLAKIMRKSKYPGLQLQAIEQILNRGWGKPANAITGEGGEGAVQIDLQEIRRTIVDPVDTGIDDEEDEDQELAAKKPKLTPDGPRADMKTIKKRVAAITKPKKG